MSLGKTGYFVAKIGNAEIYANIYVSICAAALGYYLAGSIQVFL